MVVVILLVSHAPLQWYRARWWFRWLSESRVEADNSRIGPFGGSGGLFRRQVVIVIVLVGHAP